MRVCSYRDLSCYSSALKRHRLVRNGNDTYSADFRDTCDCLQVCNSIHYMPSQSDLKFLHPFHLQLVFVEEFILKYNFTVGILFVFQK